MKSQKGFTLIELLIVIAILGILAAIVVPNVTTYLQRSNLTAANTEVDMLNTAILSYKAMGNGNPPATIADLAGYTNGQIKGTYSIAAGVLTGISYLNYNFTWSGGRWVNQ